MTHQELSAFLLRHGTVCPADVVDGHFAIVTRERARYALHEVYVNEVPQVMAKTALQPQDWSTLAVEASMLSIIQRHRRLRGIAPRCLAVDAPYRLLVMEHLGHVASLPTCSTSERTSDAARTLAALHVETVGNTHGFTAELPPVFGAMRSGLTPRPDALARLWQLMPDPRLVATGIERTAALWRQRTLIHSDVKSEHWLERASCPPAAVRLIDWELVRFGDPAWDVGCVLHEHLLTHRPAPLVPAAAAHPQIPAESRTFVNSYKERARPVMSDGFAVRMVLCTAVRLVQTALEVMSANTRVDERSLRGVLQTAESLFRHTVPLAHDLLPDVA